ncbi:hypothetical protein QR680_003869 [Steinernema hermaphroditum]|uniref:F-box domain-containing protein n=1 Tax=Steinernema hermaphroditum TaxID=289476 RepID=A0AA39LSR3_9BILA|nr:hypothetical protein QR680_003869 [Steinernema hermaphroditum]
MASLPNTIIFDILQNSNKTDFPEIRKTNETWHHLLQNILDRREKNSVAISPRRHIVKYFFWNEATDEHFKDLSEEQQKKLGALHIGDFTQKSLNDDVFTLHSICEKSPKREHDFKVQFPKLVISSSIWEMINHLSTFFPVDFEEIEVAKSLLTNMCSLRPSVKKLTIFDSMIFPDVVAQLSDFLQTMTWETVELLHVEADGDLQFEELIVKAWIGTKQPQLKSYTSDIGQPGLWKRNWPTARSPKQKIKAERSTPKTPSPPPQRRRTTKKPLRSEGTPSALQGSLPTAATSTASSTRLWPHLPIAVALKTSRKDVHRPSVLHRSRIDEALARQVLAVPRATTIFTVEDLTTIRIARSFVVLVTEVCSSVTHIDFEFKFKYT